MSITEAWQNIENHLKADAESVAQRVEQDLPAVAKFLGDAAANPVTLALSNAVHLPEAPEILASIADFITKTDAALGAAKAAAAAAAAAPAEPAAG
jgi:hypothetical protein